MRNSGWALLIAGLALVPTAGGAQVVVVSSSVQEQDAAAGQSYTGQIRLRNTGSAPQQLRVYQTDYLFHADGRTDYAEPGSHARSNAPWMRVSPASLVLPAGGEADVAYTVTVPSRAGQAPGTYWSMIMVEPETPPAAESREGIGLRTVIRHGIQVATHLRGGAEHGVRLGTPRVVPAHDGSRSLDLELLNDGEAGYRPKVSLEVYDASGAVARRAEAQRGLLYPGTSVMQRFDLAGLPAGEYEALVVVDTGAPDMFGAQFKLTVGR